MSLIQKFPEEILAEIFSSSPHPKLCIVENGGAQRENNMRLRSVASQWNRAILSTPLCWTRLCIHIDPYSDSNPTLDVINLWLERSVPYPLDIDIFAVKQPKVGDLPLEVLDLLWTQGHRIRSLTLCLDVIIIMGWIQRHDSRSLPNASMLDFVDVTVKGFSDPIFDKCLAEVLNALSSASAMKTIRLEPFTKLASQAMTENLQLKTLTRLDLTMWSVLAPQVVTVLRHCPSLISIYLQFYGAYTRFSRPRAPSFDQAPIHLPDLRIFSTIGSSSAQEGIVEILAAPILELLSISKDSDQFAYPETILRLASECPLRVLCLSGVDSHQARDIFCDANVARIPVVEVMALRVKDRHISQIETFYDEEVTGRRNLVVGTSRYRQMIGWVDPGVAPQFSEYYSHPWRKSPEDAPWKSL